MIRNSRTHGVLTKARVVGAQIPFRNRQTEVAVTEPYYLVDADGYGLVDSEDYVLQVKR